MIPIETPMKQKFNAKREKILSKESRRSTHAIMLSFDSRRPTSPAGEIVETQRTKKHVPLETVSLARLPAD